MGWSCGLCSSVWLYYGGSHLLTCICWTIFATLGGSQFYHATYHFDVILNLVYKDLIENSHACVHQKDCSLIFSLLLLNIFSDFSIRVMLTLPKEFGRYLFFYFLKNLRSTGISYLKILTEICGVYIYLVLALFYLGDVKLLLLFFRCHEST